RAIYRLASVMLYSPKWKIEAARTAVAWPSRMPSTRCSNVPTPPEAITGTGQRNVKSLLGAVSIHGGQQDFAGAERRDLARVIDSAEPGGIAPAMGEDFPALGLAGL